MVVAMPALTTTKLIINLDNGQGVQTQSFDTGDLAGAVGAAVATVSPVDLYTGNTHVIVVSHITDFYEAHI